MPFDEFETYETKPKTNPNDNRTAHVESKPELTNIAELFKKQEYKDKLTSMRELVKVADILETPIIIRGYKEDTMPDMGSAGEKDCFRMDFYFADDETKTNHYIRTEARYLWDYLKTVNELNPDILKSETLVALICKGEKKAGGRRTPFYYFAGTMDA